MPPGDTCYTIPAVGFSLNSNIKEIILQGEYKRMALYSIGKKVFFEFFPQPHPNQLFEE